VSSNPFEAVKNVQGFLEALRDLPPAPVVVGAISRLAQRAIVAEVAARGPSQRYLALMGERGFDEVFSRELHRAIFDLETGAVETGRAQ
jgi:hypothetical protein